MEPESLAKLAETGNAGTVEKEWMSVVESADGDRTRLARYDVVLAALRKSNNAALAATLAWAAIETVSAQVPPVATLEIAKPFLLAVGNGDELRAQVADLFRAAYPDREGLEELIEEAGLVGGRPVRRALRTLELCLAIDKGDYLGSRDEEEAARVTDVDLPSCMYTIDTGASFETLGAVQLADAYRKVESSDFWVMRQFEKDALRDRLWQEPAEVVIDLCRRANGELASDELERMLSDGLIGDGEWKKWWTKARAAVKKSPNVEVDGRSPYYIRYVDKPVSPEDTLEAAFKRVRDPLEQLKLVEQYLRQCKQRDCAPQPDVLRRIYETFVKRAALVARKSIERGGLLSAVACRSGQLSGIEGAGVPLERYLADTASVERALALLSTPELAILACESLVAARPNDWQFHLCQMLPKLPLAACDRAAALLAETGYGRMEFEEIVQRIVVSPIKHYEALLWLWDGPSVAGVTDCVVPIHILTRTLRMIEDVRVSGAQSNETERTIRARVRAVLSARKYERFLACLETIDMGVMRTLRRQISRAEGLAVSVSGDMLKEIDKRLPLEKDVPVIKPWEEEDVLYVTKAGLARKHAEIDHHVNVKMAENARAIGRAAEHGDLSENSEYKFALEERDLLRARLAQMNEEMGMSKVVDPADVPTDHIGIGTCVLFQRVDDGETYEMSFGGPWEADIENGWFNYKSPLAQRLMGLKVGEVVDFDHGGTTGRYEIVAIQNALLQDQKHDEPSHASEQG